MEKCIFAVIFVVVISAVNGQYFLAPTFNITYVPVSSVLAGYSLIPVKIPDAQIYPVKEIPNIPIQTIVPNTPDTSNIPTAGITDFGELLPNNPELENVQLVSNKPAWNHNKIIALQNNYTGGTVKYTCPSCWCGGKNTARGGKLLGSAVTDVLEWPWIVELIDNISKAFFCGGTIISDLFVVTAAHCIYRKTPSQITARFRDYDRYTQTEATHIDKYVTQIIVHSSWSSSNSQKYDVALLKVASRLGFVNSKIRPICLPVGTGSFAGQTATAIGWGKYSSTSDYAGKLRENLMPIISNTQCQSNLGTAAVSAHQLCAGYEGGGKATCQLDDGGPLMLVQNTRWRMVGIISMGSNCNTPVKPSLFARGTSFRQWILDQTISSGNCYCQGQTS